jgi:hypothetical protein
VDEIFDGLRLTGHFLARDLLIERQADVLGARERLVVAWAGSRVDEGGADVQVAK